MELYTVFGNKNVGKTTLVKKVLRRITEKYPSYGIESCGEITEQCALNSKNDVNNCILNIDRSISGDECCKEAIAVFIINGKRVGIYSFGDAHFYLRDALYFFAVHNCEIAINASRPSNKFRTCIAKTCAIIENKFSIRINSHDILVECGKCADNIKDFTDADIDDIIGYIGL